MLVPRGRKLNRHPFDNFALAQLLRARLFGTRDFKLSRFAGVSEAGARRRNPEHSRGIKVKLSRFAGVGARRLNPERSRGIKVKLSRFAGVRARRRNPERSRGISELVPGAGIEPARPFRNSGF